MSMFEGLAKSLDESDDPNLQNFRNMPKAPEMSDKE